MAQKILTALQKQFLDLFAENKNLRSNFYLTGGTTLAVYYLQHRYSEDLDFFSLKQIDITALNAFLKEVKILLQIKKSDFQQSFNRNIFFLHTKKKVLKAEFTYFPFEQIEKPTRENRVFIDSVVDIATNKLFTIFQNPRARDYIDLYCILQKYKKLSLPKLVTLARSKFDTYIDPLQLGTQLLKSKNVQDLPRMLQKISHRQWRSFFVNQARLLAKEILK